MEGTMPESFAGLEITRRAAIAMLGSSALGVKLMGASAFADESGMERLNQLLPKFTHQSRLLLARLLKDPGYSGRIRAACAAELAKNENITGDTLMSALLPLARNYSFAPISNFHVGAIVRGASDDFYTGANIEIPGQCLGFAVHAEQSACSNAYMHKEKAITALAVGGAPCGHCRQFIDEMSPDGAILIMIPEGSAVKLSSILPSAFGPAALGIKHGAFPVEESNISLVRPAEDSLTLAALDAARSSYAPYSKSPAGVAIRTAGGRIYRGSYIENVAFNPSLSPLQTTLASLIAGGENFAQISAVALVELDKPTISQQAVTETVLKAIAPSVKLKVVPSHS
jgi:cytidine deaminase